MLKHWLSASTTLPPTTTHLKHKPKWPWTVTYKATCIVNQMPGLIFHIFSLSSWEPAHDRSCCLRVKLNKFMFHFPAQTGLIHNKSEIIIAFYLFVGHALRMLFRNHTYMYIPTLLNHPRLNRNSQINYDNWFYWIVWGFMAQSTVLRACWANQWNIFTLLQCWLKISYM